MNPHRPEDSTETTRRSFLRQTAAAAAPLLFAAGGSKLIAAPAPMPTLPISEPGKLGGMILREKEPLNLEMPFESLQGFVTPTERFYVRCHFPIPEIDAAQWKLKVEGALMKPLVLTFEALQKMEMRTIPALLECAGNSRVFLMPQKKGAQWQLGGVGNAEWTGVPLSEVLKLAGIKKEAVEVILEGLDTGVPEAEPRPAGPIPFARSIPLKKAVKDVLLAFKMNGQELTPSHGYPVRAIVPGWYGASSIKWLSRIIVTEKPFQGYFQTVQYSIWERPDGEPVSVPLTELQVKSEIARPVVAENIPASSTYQVRGAAWSSDAKLEKVEVSFDSGATWSAAEMLGEPVVNAWQIWQYHWQVPAKPGKVTLMSRATDSRGRTQPFERNQDLNSYLISHLLPIEVEVVK